MAGLRVTAPAAGLRGRCAVPGDKSVAHRALLLGALAEGRSVVHNLPGGADVRSTLAAVQALGAAVGRAGAAVTVEGRAPLPPPGTVTVDCGNSGTTMRLVAGIAAGGAGTVVLDGDASLRRRPMERVAAPLRAMGARVDTTAGHAPVHVHGARLAAIDWTLPVASAQVKTAILLAALRASGTTRVREPLPTRDHTERLLGHFGGRVAASAGCVALEGPQRLTAAEVVLPGDVSSAAFLVVAALLVPGSDLALPGVGVNPTRTGALAILRRMGAEVTVEAARDVGGEPQATLRVRASRLVGTAIRPEEVPAAIDELPILCVAAALARGRTTISGAGELRVKESDRIAALEQLRLLGVPVTASADGLVVDGSGGRPLAGARVASGGDHRIAMAFAVAGLASTGGVVVDDPECAEVSFPGFFDRLRDLGAVVEPA
jgi:3-phosphoshikimate 1-carboxyvinyltransferase